MTSSAVIFNNIPYKVIPLPAFKDNYIWLMVNLSNHHAVVVDPGDSFPVVNYLLQHELKLSAILITHHHWDHVNGIHGLTQHQSLPVYGPAYEKIRGVTHPVEENQRINLPGLDLSFQVLHIPGHTLGHVAYYHPLGLFCGDTLFGGGCGRLFEGTAEQMIASLDKLMNLPDNTLIYCGHEYTVANLKFAQLVEPTNSAISHRLQRVVGLRQNEQPSLPSTIAEEKLTNPFVRKDLPPLKTAAENKVGKKIFNSVEIFATIRQWKDNYQVS